MTHQTDRLPQVGGFANGTLATLPKLTPVFADVIANTVGIAVANVTFLQANVLGFTNASVLAGGSVFVTTSGTLEATTAEWDAVTEGAFVGGLSPGLKYYLSATAPGQITTVAPSTVGQFITPVGTATSTTKMNVRVYPDTVIAVAVAAGQALLTIQDEGVPLGAAGAATTVNFTGAGVAASLVGSTLTVNVPGGGGGGFTGTRLVIPARVLNTVYTNLTGKPLYVEITAEISTAAAPPDRNVAMALLVAGINVHLAFSYLHGNPVGGIGSINMHYFVPAGSTYEVVYGNDAGVTVDGLTWEEFT